MLHQYKNLCTIHALFNPLQVDSNRIIYMMQRRPSISEMSQPGALVPQQEPAYVAPFNPHGEGQQVAAEHSKT
jgi:hypothetical protein